MMDEKTFRKIQTQLEVVEEELDRLTEWEREEFIPSISDQFTRNGTLTVPQQDKLQQIYDKVA
jgi:hypothetical protein